MRVGIDVQAVANGNRTGLFTYLRDLVRELRILLDDEVCLLAARSPKTSSARELSVLMGGAQVNLLRPAGTLARLISVLSPLSDMALIHHLHGSVPSASDAPNIFVVPDLIPLAIDYGIPHLEDLYVPFYERAAREGDVVVVWSEHTKQDFLKRIGGSPDRVRVAPLAAGPEFRPPADDLSVLRSRLKALGLDDAPYILVVATLEKRKNHATLLRAFARLLQRDRSLPHRLVIVGQKWVGHESVFDEIRRLGIGERVTYLGFADDLPTIYGGADAFVFPSLYEGFGLPVLEAMACAVPVLAANATSLPEVVGDAGVLFEPDDVNRLCDALHRMLVDRPYHDDLASRGLQRSSEFSWRRTAELYVDALNCASNRFQERAGAGRSLLA
jgi:glycosyltransferase involved in cell wall biosynthesis